MSGITAPLSSSTPPAPPSASAPLSAAVSSSVPSETDESSPYPLRQSLRTNVSSAAEFVIAQTFIHDTTQPIASATPLTALKLLEPNVRTYVGHAVHNRIIIRAIDAPTAAAQHTFQFTSPIVDLTFHPLTATPQFISALVTFKSATLLHFTATLTSAPSDRRGKDLLFNNRGVISDVRVTAVRWVPKDISGRRFATKSSSAPSATAKRVGESESERRMRKVTEWETLRRSSEYEQFKAEQRRFDVRRGAVDQSIGGWDRFIVAHANGAMFVYDRTFDGESIATLTDVRTDSEWLSVRHNSAAETNPLAAFKLTGGACINALEFNHAGNKIGVVQSDGFATIIHYVYECVVARFRSYYGALTCVAWSTDDRLMVTGGEDDCVTLFDTLRHAVIARGVGHRSYVSRIIFRPPADDGTYRFASAGQDGYIAFWEYTMSKQRRNAVAVITESTGKTAVQAVTSLVKTISPLSTNRVHHRAIRDLTSTFSYIDRRRHFAQTFGFEVDQLECADEIITKTTAAANASSTSLLSTSLAPSAASYLMSVCDEHIVRIWRRRVQSVSIDAADDDADAFDESQSLKTIKRSSVSVLRTVRPIVSGRGSLISHSFSDSLSASPVSHSRSALSQMTAVNSAVHSAIHTHAHTPTQTLND